MKLSLHLKWYDLWIGAYIDCKQKTIFICPLPMIVIRINMGD